MTSAHAAPDDRVFEEERARLPRRPAPGQGAEAIFDLQRSHGDQGVGRCRAGRRLQRVQHERIAGGLPTGPIPARDDICSADDPKKHKEHEILTVNGVE
jgi:hypothetical protein